MENTSDLRQSMDRIIDPSSSWWIAGYLESQTLWNCCSFPSASCGGCERDTHVFRSYDGVLVLHCCAGDHSETTEHRVNPVSFFIRSHPPFHPSQMHILMLWSLMKLPSAGLAPQKWEWMGNGGLFIGPSRDGPEEWSLPQGWAGVSLVGSHALHPVWWPTSRVLPGTRHMGRAVCAYVLLCLAADVSLWN